MNDVLVFYATTEGQTGRIAERIAAVLRDRGFRATAIDLQTPGAFDVDWTGVRAVILGASLHLQHHQPVAAEFAETFSASLNALPSAFFSVSLSAAAHDERQVQAARDLARAFVRAAHWKPQRVVCFAGGLAYSKYGFLKRLAIRLISKRNGGPTDTRRDYDLTDWDAVWRFALDVAAGLAEQGPAIESRHHGTGEFAAGGQYWRPATPGEAPASAGRVRLH